MDRAPDFEGETAECEGCPDVLPIEELDEEGYCRPCGQAFSRQEAERRYWERERW
jgi:rRNA maturation endonuclease Nob1